MTTLLPAECRFSPTLLGAASSSFHQPSAHGQVAVQDTPALPGYKILEVLGRGGMATVYKARQLGTKRLVAVKVIDRSLAGYGEIVTRFRQEHALGARLSHPNLTTVYQSGRAAGCLYLVMELVEGDSLGELIGRCGLLPVAEACEVIRQAALGLAYLHDHGIVHRDIKPSNLMLTPAGQVKVLDLGLARHLHEPDAGERITRHGQFLGTLDYVAPEQCTNPHAVDIRADVYGLGCTLYELLAGQPPFARPGYESAFEKMKAHVEAPVPPIQDPRPDVPVQLASARGGCWPRTARGGSPAPPTSSGQCNPSRSVPSWRSWLAPRRGRRLNVMLPTTSFVLHGCDFPRIRLSLSWSATVDLPSKRQWRAASKLPPFRRAHVSALRPSLSSCVPGPVLWRVYPPPLGPRLKLCVGKICSRSASTIPQQRPARNTLTPVHGASEVACDAGVI